MTAVLLPLSFFKVAHCSFQGGLYSCEMTYIPGADTMISWRFGGEMEDIIMGVLVERQCSFEEV